MSARTESKASSDEEYMRECIRLAMRGRGRVSPNPLVGAVLVREHKVISRGWHRRFGGPHAEIDCLEHVKGNLHKSTLYVNLEPCSHYGKTPPCTDRIISSGIRAVVIGTRDPNPRVAGRGIRRLRSAGIKVTSGVLEKEAKEVNRFFLKHITQSLPYVHLKVAQSIDGFIGGSRAPRYLSSPQSLRLAHRWRTEYDAVLVGAGTIRTDNPHLNVRHHRGRDPHVVIIDGRLSIEENANALRRESGRGIFVCVADEYARRLHKKVSRLEARGIVVLRFRAKKGAISIRDALAALYKFSIGSIMVEGGRSILTQFAERDLVDELSVFVTPLLLGSGIPAFGPGRRGAPPFAREMKFQSRPVGEDMLFTTRLTQRS